MTKTVCPEKFCILWCGSNLKLKLSMDKYIYLKFFFHIGSIMRTLWIFKVVVWKNEKNTFNKKNRLKIAKNIHTSHKHIYIWIEILQKQNYCKCNNCKPSGHIFKTGPENPVKSYVSDKTCKWYFGIHFIISLEVSIGFTFNTFTTKKICNNFYQDLNLFVWHINNFGRFKYIFFTKKLKLN